MSLYFEIYTTDVQQQVLCYLPLDIANIVFMFSPELCLKQLLRDLKGEFCLVQLSYIKDIFITHLQELHVTACLEIEKRYELDMLANAIRILKQQKAPQQTIVFSVSRYNQLLNTKNLFYNVSEGCEQLITLSHCPEKKVY